MTGVLSLTKFEFNNVPFDVIVANDDGENKSYFFGSKVAAALGFKRPQHAVVRHCPRRIGFNDLRGAPEVHPFAGGPELQPHTLLIPETDVYRLVMKSQKPEALELQDFVCETVLPSIRKHGQYPPPEQQQHVPAIGYNIGVHEDRMRHFETLDDEQRKDMRKETLSETNSLKSERHVDIGGRGGKKRVFNERRRYEILKMDYEQLLEDYYNLQDDYDLLQEELEFYHG